MNNFVFKTIPFALLALVVTLVMKKNIPAERFVKKVPVVTTDTLRNNLPTATNTPREFTRPDRRMVYRSDIPSGSIGIAPGQQTDDGTDNVCQIAICTALTNDQGAFIE